MRALEGEKTVRQELTALVTGLHERLRPCDGEVCLEILVLLAEGERSVGSLATMLRLEMPAVSARLGVLKQEGLVASRTDGRRRLYELSGQVRVGAWHGETFLEIKCSVGGARLMIVMPPRFAERLRGLWAEMEQRVVESRLAPEVRVRRVTVGEIGARARAIRRAAVRAQEGRAGASVTRANRSRAA